MKDRISEQDTTRVLTMIYGKDLMCTNGLYHLFNKDHAEVYINRDTSELDKRGLYRTLVVLDDIVVAKVLNNKEIKFVILDKFNLKCLYKTTGTIHYIDENILCDKKDKSCTIITRTGKTTKDYKSALCVEKLHDNTYLLKQSGLFSDILFSYSKRYDEINELNNANGYMINILDKDKGNIEVATMVGGKYIYNVFDKSVINQFTSQEEKKTRLFNLV